MFCQFPEKGQLIIGIWDFPQCFLPLSREKLIHNWENEGISVEKGRWGKVFVISGKKRKQLDSKKDPKTLTLEEAKTILKS